MPAPRTRPLVIAALVLAGLWGGVLGLKSLARGQATTAASVRAWLAQHPLPPADRGAYLDQLAGQINRLSGADRLDRGLERDLRGVFGRLSSAQQQAYLDATLPRGFDAFGRVSRTQLNAVIDRVGLTQRIDHKVGTYSHGMRQRLALAQALLPRPEVLLLDEPTDGLDPEGIADFRSTLLALHNELGLTILFSSHLLGEVEKICTRVAVMRRGRKVFDGDWRADAAGENRFTLVVDRRPEALELLARAGLITPPRRADGPLTLATGWGLADVNAKLVHAGFGVRTIAPRPRTLEHFYLDQRALAGDTPPPASGDAAC